MRILVASDKWKGCLSAGQACAAVAEGLAQAEPGATVERHPIADGGEGTLAAVKAAVKGAVEHEEELVDARGRPVRAKWLMLPGRRAVIEMAQTAGLTQVDDVPLQPWLANTFGLGLLVKQVLREGAETIIIGLGGSATNDAGSGLARALGWEFEGCRVLPIDLARLEGVQAPDFQAKCRVLAACDVENPLLGSQGCTRVFGPQKGVKPEDFSAWDAALERLASFFPAELAGRPGAGAAGGMGWGLSAFLGAEIVSGFSLLAEMTGLEAAVAAADVVITGEGSLDGQTLNGKGPHGVAQMARRLGKPVIGVGGLVTPEVVPHFSATLAVKPEGLTVEEAIPRGRELIVAAVARHWPALRAQAGV